MEKKPTNQSSGKPNRAPNNSGSKPNNDPADKQKSSGNKPNNDSADKQKSNGSKPNNGSADKQKSNGSKPSGKKKKSGAAKQGSAPVKPEAPRPRTVAGQLVEYHPDPKAAENDRENRLQEDKLELATMSFRERLKVKKERRAKEMEGMNLKERIKYLLYYFQWHIIISTIVIGCLVWIILAVINRKPPVALAAAVLNKDYDKVVTEEIFSTYMTEANINPTYRALVECFHLDLATFAEDYRENPDDPDFIRFPSLARESYFDIVITSRGGLDYCAYNELAVYPDYVLPLDLVDALKPYEVKAEDYNKQSFVYGYDISGTEFAKSLDLGYDKIYLCFPGSTTESQIHAENFVRYIFNLPRQEQ